MAIEKKDTSKYIHMRSSILKGAEIPEDSSTPLLLFSASRGKEDSTEVVLPMTIEAFARVSRGAGTYIKELRKGLLGNGRFSFVILIERNESEKDSKGKAKKGIPKVVGIHCVPVDNYLDADFQEELRMTLDEDAAVVYFRPTTGEMDVAVFPASIKKNLPRFVSELEKLTSLDQSTEFKAGDIIYSVSSISGNMAVFSCHVAAPRV